MTLQKLSPWAIGAVCFGVPRLAWADEPPPQSPIVVRYEAPPECPNAEAFAASVRAELAGRRWDASRPLQVHVVVTAGERGYDVAIASSTGAGAPLERRVSAPTCADATAIAAAIVTLAQSDEPSVVVAPPPPAPSPPSPPPPPPPPTLPAPPHPAPAASEDSEFVYSFSLGYGAFVSGPATPVVYNSVDEKTTFNPAQGVRLGFGITHSIGWWKHSLHLSAAYYRQSTTTTIVPAMAPTPTPTQPPSIEDRDVLLATLDACPVQLDVAFLSLMPCATFSMMQSRGQSGNNPGLETGIGGSARLRATWNRFFAEATGSGVKVSSSYEEPSSPFRLFYSLSLGVQFR